MENTPIQIGAKHKQALEKIADCPEDMQISINPTREYFTGFCCGRYKEDSAIEIIIGTGDYQTFRMHTKCHEYMSNNGVEEFYTQLQRSRVSRGN